MYLFSLNSIMDIRLAHQSLAMQNIQRFFMIDIKIELLDDCSIIFTLIFENKSLNLMACPEKSAHS